MNWEDELELAGADLEGREAVNQILNGAQLTFSCLILIRNENIDFFLDYSSFSVLCTR
jgi:hypothetical protein